MKDEGPRCGRAGGVEGEIPRIPEAGRKVRVRWRGGRRENSIGMAEGFGVRELFQGFCGENYILGGSGRCRVHFTSFDGGLEIINVERQMRGSVVVLMEMKIFQGLSRSRIFVLDI